MSIRHTRLSNERSQMGNHVKVGRTKKGKRYTSVSRKFIGGYDVKTTIIDGGKRIELRSTKHTS